MVETIIVIAIIGLIVAIAIPYFAGFLRRVRLDSEARQIDMALLKARVEAIRRGNNVCLLTSTDPSSSFTAKDTAGNTITVSPYRSAILYVDTNADGSLGSSETVIANLPMSPGSNTLTFRIDNYNATSPSSASTTFNFIFTAFGSSTSAGSSKAVFISDVTNNVIQVGIPVAASGKVAMTKYLTGTGYVTSPWTWY